MTIILTIDNVDSLPDGGPVRYEARNHGFEIGREQHLDWTLPDPARYISGRHCEIRYENGAYWLYDVSRNGTFLNGAQNRVKSPHRLVHGDRLAIGHYIISVETGQGEAADTPPPAAVAQPVAQPPAVADIWDTGAAAPTPVGRRDVLPVAPARHSADFSEEFVELPPMRWPEAAPPPFAPERSPQSESPFGAGSAGWPPESSPPPSASFGGGDGFVPAPVPQPPPPAPIPASRPAGASGQGFIEGLAAGAGLPAEAFMSRDPREVGFEIGEFLRVSVENLAQLLRARAAAKAMTKSSSRTMIGAADNNPLKFVPAAAEAIEIMFRRHRPGYLGPRQSLEEAFADLKRHELATYAAMQKALARLLEDLSPETIEAKVGASAFPLKKGRAWDQFVKSWEEKSANDNGMLDVFLAYFAEAYDEASRRK